MVLGLTDLFLPSSDPAADSAGWKQGRPRQRHSFFQWYLPGRFHTDKKKLKVSSYIRKFRVEQLQGHI
jgi:hypothetical protein